MVFFNFSFMSCLKIVVLLLFRFLSVTSLFNQTFILLSKYLNLSFIRWYFILHNLYPLLQRFILFLTKLQNYNSILQLLNQNIFLLKFFMILSFLILFNNFDLIFQLFVILNLSFHSIVVFNHLIKVIC